MLSLNACHGGVAGSVVCTNIAMMSGRIKIKGAEANGEPVELYTPYQPSEFDAMCGTFETAPYAADASPNLCPDQVFLCNEGTSSFEKCMHAVDCKMNYE
eukprot:scaffold304027_cov36-Prasinocladus_malaysianus.AAC.1